MDSVDSNIVTELGSKGEETSKRVQEKGRMEPERRQLYLEVEDTWGLK